jgi:hypothetical protein
MVLHFKSIFMRQRILISVIIFVFWSCAPNDVTFDSKTKKEIMNSWAWKIFIFTDEGEFVALETTSDKFIETTKVSPIFVKDVLKIYTNDDLFLNNEIEAFNDPIVFTNFNLTKRKK